MAALLFAPLRKRVALPVLAMTLAPAALSQPSAPQPFVITDPAQVQSAEALFQHVQALTQVVTPCVDSRQGTPAECVCRFPAQLARLQQEVRNVQARYPSWQGKVVNWTQPASKLSRAISMDALSRQSSAQCPSR